MKKSFRTVMIAIFAIMFVFVSCNPAPDGDAQGRAILTTDGTAGRSLTVADPSFDAGTLYWKYATQKVDTLEFTTGQTASYDEAGAVKVAEGTGLKGSVGPFSQGLWNFKLFAYTDAACQNLAWSGETLNQRIVAGNGNRVAVKVSAMQTEGKTGSLAIGDIALKDGTSAHTAIDKSNLTQVVRYWKDGAQESGATVDKSNSPSWTAEIDGIPSGGYWVEVKYVDKDNEAIVRGSEKKWVNIFDNVTTTIGGFLSENTGSAELDAQSEVKKAVSPEVVVQNDQPTKLEVAATPESGKTEQKTAVDIPAGVLKSEGGNAKVDVTTYTAPKANEMFTVTDGSGATALAGIDLTLTQATAGEVTTFEQPVTVTTYITKGLDPAKIDVKYSGAGEQPIFERNDLSTSSQSATGYDPTTGELRFQTTHFSQFFVTSTDIEAMNTTRNISYPSLAAAVKDAVDGDLIVLLRDIVSDGNFKYIFVNSKITIDFNGKKMDIRNHNDDIFWIYSNGDLTLDNAVIDATGEWPLTTFRNGGRLTLNDGTFNIAWNGRNYKPMAIVTCIPPAGNDEKPNYLIVNGGKFNGAESAYCISSNGTKGYYSEITLNGPDMTGAIYFPSAGILNINGGRYVNDGSVISQKSGTLNISDGYFEALSGNGRWAHNGSGTYYTGNAILVEACDYPGGEPVVNITGGEFVGAPANPDKDYVSDPIMLINWKNPKTSKQYMVSKNIVPSVEYTELNDLSGYAQYLLKAGNPVIDNIWNGTECDTSWYDDETTSQKTYYIRSAGQLAGLAKIVNEGNDLSGKKIILTIDVDLADMAWTPIGTTDRNATTGFFKGNFDGQNHKIMNLKPVDPNRDDSVTGLFGCVGGNGSIRNLVIESGNVVNTGDTAAGLVGYVASGAGETFTIDNCHVKSGVSVSVPKAYVDQAGNETRGTVAAGLLGRAYGEGTLNLRNCTNAASVTGNSKTAGVVGACNTKVKLTVAGCTNTGNITDETFYAGGILAWAQGETVNINGCRNEGAVSSKKHAGGIVGMSSWSATHLEVSNCTNTGSVTTQNTDGNPADGEANPIIGHIGNPSFKPGITSCN